MGRILSVAPALAGLVALSALAGCKPKNVGEAEAKHDAAWLAQNGTSEAMAALGRLADTDDGARQALEERAGHDVNAHIAAWVAVTRGKSWGQSMLDKALADPTRAELAASALPRKDPRLAPFVPALEGAVERLSAGRRGSVIAGVLASLDGPAKDAVERRLRDPKTRAAMCDGIGLPEASDESRAALLGVAEAREQPNCLAVLLAIAEKNEKLLAWVAKSGEPGLLSAAAKGEMSCPTLARVWRTALTERPPAEHVALTVPLKLATQRCASTFDPVLADMLAKNPRARGCILAAIEPFGPELGDMKDTCQALRGGYIAAEPARLRERATDALANGCRNRR